MQMQTEDGIAVWWPSGPDDGVPEPAISFTGSSDVLMLRQGGNEILVTWADVPDFMRALRLASTNVRPKAAP
jgi:hypothetical protein